MSPLLRTCLLSVTLLAGAMGLAPAPAVAAAPATAVLSVGQIARQDIAPQPGSEPDTLVEPDVAVSPLDSRIAVAAAHDGRFPDGGAVDISHAWTHDGGLTWHHSPVPHLTKALGGKWDRVSDPVVAFGSDGTVYLSTLLFDAGCSSAVGVSRSVDGGVTFGPPVLAHLSTSCQYSDDKNWLVVDTSPGSPHRGRLYQFWTPFSSDAQGNLTGYPQVLRTSDDQGRHWSQTISVSAPDAHTQNSQPMIQYGGIITDTYLNFGAAGGGEGPEHRPSGVQASIAPAATTGDRLVARTSHDGGATWSPEVTITQDVGPGPDSIRCCLPSAVADPATGLLYAAWNSVRPDRVRLSRSADGRHWSPPVQVNRIAGPGFDTVNVDVAAYAGRVFVSYGTRDTKVAQGRYVQQQMSTSANAGQSFGPPISLGGLSDLKYAAFARGIFPGDYIGTAAAGGRVYAVWCRSSQPPVATAKYHQTLYGAVLRP